MRKLGDELESQPYWEEATKNYVNNLTGDYHTHRLAVIDALIPKELYQSGRRIFDFGCGNALHFPQFTKHGAHIEGVDISAAMLATAHNNLAEKSLPRELARLGGVEAMKELPAAAFDAVISFNVLAYLTDAEENAFYTQATRIVKPGGQLIVTHSNELFDLFSLNGLTANFFVEHFAAISAGKLLVNNAIVASQPLYNVRENPLAYRFKLAGFGFEEVQQEFINFHALPPAQMPERRSYVDTLSFSADQRWKLMFQCSTYGSRAVRRSVEA